MKIVGVESLEVGDIFVVRNVSNTLFSNKIEIEKLRSEEEVDEMIRYAHENLGKLFWSGVKYVLFWMMGTIEKREVKEDGEK